MYSSDLDSEASISTGKYDMQTCQSIGSGVYTPMGKLDHLRLIVSNLSSLSTLLY